MNVLSNSFKVDVFHLVSRYMVAEDPLTMGGYSGVVEIEWEGPAWVSPRSFESYLRSVEGGCDPMEFLEHVMVMLWQVMEPRRLTVTVHVESPHHGSFALSKTMTEEIE